jgi:hypothetical protein
MKRNLAHKLIESHLVEGKPVPEEEIAIRIEQTGPDRAVGAVCRS